MYYSMIGALAMLVILTENQDILFGKNRNTALPVWKVYRRFLIVVLTYHVTDVLWGILESQKLVIPLFIDTLLYFIAMALGVLFWTQFTITYLNEKNRFGRFLLHTGRVFSAGVILLVLVNIFVPVLFSVDENCVYHAHFARYIILVIQILLLILISAYALYSIFRKKGAVVKRYRTLAFFGLIMALFLTIQIWFPYLPLYGVAYLLGTCILHSFVIVDENEEYKHDLEESLKREKKQYEELKSARELAYTDALTGVKSKLAYIETGERLDGEIKGRRPIEFAVAVFDLNDLKDVNDRKGHEFGDQYIINACDLISGVFGGCPIYRIGGDEFAVILEGRDYRNREALASSFNRLIDEGRPGRAVVAMGISDYYPERDLSFYQVFERADQSMYERKRLLKKRKEAAQ